MSIQSLKEKWFKSRLYKSVEKIISRHYCRKLKNKDFTILCSNCIGGCIYHRFGMKFLSPTINLYFDQHDFVKFCLNLDEYIEAKLVFVESKCNYPVGKLVYEGLPEITLNFVHYNSYEEAAEKWDERKRRINKDNLYIILFNINGITVEELNLLHDYKCRNKALITWKEMPEIPWSVRVYAGKNNDYMQRNIFGLRVFERNWDVISFLNK